MCMVTVMAHWPVFTVDRAGPPQTPRPFLSRGPKPTGGLGGEALSPQLLPLSYPACPLPYTTAPCRSRPTPLPPPPPAAACIRSRDAPTRSPWQRDRDRIIHSSAFRKLQYKTQVFVNHVGDFFRTRLTHSIEVAQIARSIARELSLDEDLAEALALAHDLGHPPFGHAGEDGLNICMKPVWRLRS